MPAWAKIAIDQWIAAAGIQGRLLRAVNKGDRIVGDGMTAQSVFEVVEKYGRRIGSKIAPHELRRSFAKLAHKGHAALEQIQISWVMLRFRHGKVSRNRTGPHRCPLRSLGTARVKTRPRFRFGPAVGITWNPTYAAESDEDPQCLPDDGKGPASQASGIPGSALIYKRTHVRKRLMKP